jgi:predicted metal-dependent hydrolase
MKEQEKNIISTRWNDRADFKACVHDYAQKMNVSIKSLSLRPMKNKWASCSTDSNLYTPQTIALLGCNA